MGKMTDDLAGGVQRAQTNDVVSSPVAPLIAGAELVAVASADRHPGSVVAEVVLSRGSRLAAWHLAGSVDPHVVKRGTWAGCGRCDTRPHIGVYLRRALLRVVRRLAGVNRRVVDRNLRRPRGPR